MRVIIAGSRGLTVSPTIITAKLDQAGWLVTEVVSGCAAGVDRSGEQWARARGIVVKPFPADWGRYGKRAGFLRNQLMAEYGDALLVFWDGASRGTANMVTTMCLERKPTFLVPILRREQ